MLGCSTVGFRPTPLVFRVIPTRTGIPDSKQEAKSFIRLGFLLQPPEVAGSSVVHTYGDIRVAAFMCRPESNRQREYKGSSYQWRSVC